MKTCRKCQGTKIKSRRNYSHGKKSKAITTLSCKKCGSIDIEVRANRWGNKFKK